MIRKFKTWQRNRMLDRKSIQRVLSEQDDIKFIDLDEPKLFGPPNDRREYVALAGFFVEDTFFIDIPDVNWYVRSDGNIWSEWRVRLKMDTTIWQEELNSRGKDLHRIGDLSVNIPMSASSKEMVNRLTKELWVMHKLTI